MSYLAGLLRCEIPLEEHEKADLRAWLETLKSDCDMFGEAPERRRMATIRSKLDEKKRSGVMSWTKTATAKPACSKKPDSHGTQVLIWPHAQSGDGYAASPTAFYGCRQTAEPQFYLYGAVLHPQPTHWAHLPDGPKSK